MAYRKADFVIRSRPAGYVVEARDPSDAFTSRAFRTKQEAIAHRDEMLRALNEEEV